LSFFSVFQSQAAAPIVWDRLNVTFRVWTAIPMTSDDAEIAGYEPSAYCDDPDAYFFGNRYSLDEDFSANPIYDSNGRLVGVQSAVYNPLRPGAPYVLEGELYTLTAYFVNPARICDAPEPGPDDSNVAVNWDRIWLQNGEFSKEKRMTEDAYVEFPLHQTDAAANLWVKGTCFPTMGHHYLFNASVTQDCDTLFPVFIMYNSGKLSTIAFYTLDSPLDTSSRWETPGVMGLAAAYDKATVPKCLLEKPVLQTRIMHTYVSDPLKDLC